MSNRSPQLLVGDILEAISKIERYVQSHNAETFNSDDKTVDAVARNLEIIGEAAKRMPEEFKSSHCEIEWAKIVGLRNRIIHAYFGLDNEIIWNILQHDIPAFRKAMGAVQQELSTAL